MQDEESLLSWVPRLRRYARALVCNRDDADDLVQDTLERAWSRSEHWARVTDMRAWLFGIMHNMHVDGVRRPQLQTVPIDHETPDIAVPPTQGDLLAVTDLAGALAQLPLEQREVMLLVALEDMSYIEVSTALGIPMGTVMSRLSRGRERLRAIMENRSAPPSLRVVK